MADREAWQVSSDAAAVYERCFVPALFAAWAPVVARAAAISAGDRALDVACGTGVLARRMAELVGPSGSVTGLDINAAMLAVARQTAPGVDWQQGNAIDLPFDDASFTKVASQFGLMFFPDRIAAVREMWRVLAPGGRLAIAAWASVDEAPGYQALVDVATEHVGAQAASVFAAPFILGDTARLQKIMVGAGIGNAEIALERGRATFASIEEFIRIEVKASPLAESLDQKAMDRLAMACEAALSRYFEPSGAIVMPIGAYIVTADKPAA